jgi:hypothetical protein
LEKKKAGRPRKAISDVTPNHACTLIDPIVDYLREKSKELGISVTQLCGRVIQRENYTEDRPLGEFGKLIFEDKFHDYLASKKMSLDEAEYFKNHELNIGVRDWTNTKLRCGKFGMKVTHCMIFDPQNLYK